ncbi:PAS domain-containing protein [Halobaculum lipolyticum]|uniref:PAS domain-containing protein n=1 Tax=Halobaculum lipolyticum TaxID=3032001 RepID=A0ABD5W6T0_9EURY|nr:PAS domain-containing protein [Halobaculum sp. DT31]
MTSNGRRDAAADGGTPTRGRPHRTGPPTSASTDAVDEGLKTRTMDEAPVGITVADATEPEMPLVYANAAFERITGYPPSYAVGRNCRFLQGEATRAEPVDRMREAIREGEATTVELRNYRRDGSLFWNEVTIAPLRDDAGAVAHYVGFQQDVTRRKRAERAAAERATRIERERAAQKRLLHRLNGVVADVTAAATGATSREALEGDVAESMARAYAGAWVGRYDPSTDEVAPVAAAGTTAGDAVGRRLSVAAADGSDPVESTVAAAVADRFVRTTAVDGAGGTDGVADATAVAAIPLHYGDATFGAVGVYTDADEGFAGNERPVLTALGRTVATGINAIESQRTLRDEETIELRLRIDDHPLAAFASRAGCELTSVGQVDDRAVPSTLFEVSTVEEPFDAERLRAAATDAVTVHSLLVEGTDAPVVELSVADPTLRDALAEHGAELAAVTVEASLVTATVYVARETLAQSLVAAVTDRFECVDLAGYSRRSRREPSRPEFVAALRESLTERQHATLVRAYTAGYFEWPHETSGEEVATAMGVSRSTFHQHLRAAQKKLAAAFLESGPPAGRGDPN